MYVYIYNLYLYIYIIYIYIGLYNSYIYILYYIYIYVHGCMNYSRCCTYHTSICIDCVWPHQQLQRLACRPLRVSRQISSSDVFPLTAGPQAMRRAYPIRSYNWPIGIGLGRFRWRQLYDHKLDNSLLKRAYPVEQEMRDAFKQSEELQSETTSICVLSETNSICFNERRIAYVSMRDE